MFVLSLRRKFGQSILESRLYKITKTRNKNSNKIPGIILYRHETQAYQKRRLNGKLMKFVNERCIPTNF